SFFEGVERTTVRRQAHEGESLAEGNIKFSFSLYQLICKEMRKQTKNLFCFRAYVFGDFIEFNVSCWQCRFHSISIF
ncbi:hypothetical protein PHMEG_0007247, partial [Phytophthora megakarya]